MSEQGDIVSLVLAAIGGGGLGSLLLGSAQVWLGRRKPQLDEADLSTKWADLAQRAFTEASSARRETDALRLRVDVLEKKTHADARRIRGLLAELTAQAWRSLPPVQGALWRVCAALSSLLGEDYDPTHYPEEGQCLMSSRA